MPFTGRIGVFAMAFACLGVSVSGFLQRQPAPPQKVEIPATATSLEGVPTVRIEFTEGKTTRRVLSAAEAAKERLTVRAVNGQFYWTSRDNLPLRLSSSGEFTYLSSEPGRYIRFTRVDDKIQYVEHVDLGSSGNRARGSFGSITWWGELRIVVQK